MDGAAQQHPALKDIQIVDDILILKKRHKLIRRMQRKLDEPEIHGYQVWGSSYLIMDYLKQHPPGKKTKVTEIGCGWGILGIFCAHHFGATVTAVDADSHVFPYLEAHALLNDVKIEGRVAKYQDLSKKDFRGQNLVLGGDICFWDNLVDPLYQAVKTAVSAGVEQIIIADPGRSPFHKLAKRCCKQFNAEHIDWSVSDPKAIHGELLIVRGRK